MELKRLRVFVATAYAASFREAADRLSTQISVVSRTIAALEGELGVSLFERGPRGVRLTDVGRAFLNDARRILADVERARDAAQAIATGTTGRLRLGVCEDATTQIFARVLAAFRRALPEVMLDLFERPSALQPAALIRGEIDAGLLLPPVPLDGVELNELWRDPWAVALPPDHPLLGSDAITLAELARHDFITAHPEFGPGCHHQAQALFASAAFSRASSHGRSTDRRCSPWCGGRGRDAGSRLVRRPGDRRLDVQSVADRRPRHKRRGGIRCGRSTGRRRAVLARRACSGRVGGAANHLAFVVTDRSLA